MFLLSLYSAGGGGEEGGGANGDVGRKKEREGVRKREKMQRKRLIER